MGKLTEEQEAEGVKRAADEAFEVMVANQPVDFDRAKHDIRVMYEYYKLEPPKEYILAKSPIEVAKMFDSWPDVKSGSLSHIESHGRLDYFSYTFKKYEYDAGKKIDLNEIETWKNVLSNCFFIYRLEDKMILSDAYCELNWVLINNRFELHKDGGPALAFPDGYKYWSLNGVRVDQEIAETPGEKLDATLMVKEKNVEVRREILRKIGSEIAMKKLGAKVVDSDTVTVDDKPFYYLAFSSLYN